MTKDVKRSGIGALIVIGIVSVGVWERGGPGPVYVYGMAAILWLLTLMVRGVFSAPFKPYLDEEPPSNSSRPAP
jgi:hypothetical protein